MTQKNRPESGIAAELQTRRKIVKCIAGLPAIMTLASGSALANTSSMQCLDTTEGKYRPTPSAPGSTRPECILDSAAQEVNPPGGIWVETGDDAVRLPDQDGEYCLLYVDNDGNEIVSGGTEMDLVTPSCYTSFITHATTPP